MKRNRIVQLFSGILVAVALVLSVLVAVRPTQAAVTWPADNDSNWHTSGTVEWQVANGTLFVKPTSGDNGIGTFPTPSLDCSTTSSSFGPSEKNAEGWTFAPIPYDNGGVEALAPWYGSSPSNSDITSIQAKGTIVLPSEFYSLMRGGWYDTNCGPWYSGGHHLQLTMFSGMSNLTDISGLSHFDMSNAGSFYYLFADDPKLTDLTPLENWDVSKIHDFKEAFQNDTSLTSLNGLQNWKIGNGSKYDPDQNNIDFFDHIFSGDTKLTDISELGDWDVSHIKDFTGDFQNDTSLTNLGGTSSTPLQGLKTWQPTAATNMTSMFQGDTNLAAAPLGDWKLPNLENATSMFQGDVKLTDSKFDNWGCGNLVTATSMFENTGLENPDFSGWRPTRLVSAQKMFYNDPSLADPKFGQWTFADNANATQMFADDPKLDKPVFSKWAFGSNSTLSQMFASDTSLSDISGLQNWDVSKVTNLDGLFINDKNITSLAALSDWNVSKVSGMRESFAGLTQLQSLAGLDKWETSSLSDDDYGAAQLFGGDINLSDASALKDWDFSNAQNSLKNYNIFSTSTNFSDLPTIQDGGEEFPQTATYSHLQKMGMNSSMRNIFPSTIYYGDRVDGYQTIFADGTLALTNYHNGYTTGSKSWGVDMISEDRKYGPYDADTLYHLMAADPKDFPGRVYVRAKASYLVTFDANGGNGTQRRMAAEIDKKIVLPKCNFFKLGKVFAGWSTSANDATNLLKAGDRWAPANPQGNQTYTLYAQWKDAPVGPVPPISHQGGMLPGWTQTGSENTSGVLPGSGQLAAGFTNKYSPHSVSVSFRFTKLVDGKVPTDSYSFSLYQGSGSDGKTVASTPLQTVQSVGSAVVFKPISFTSAGTYHYYVHEDSSLDPTITVDTHLVSITVTTALNSQGNLTASVQYSGNTTFNNHYLPASLKVSKIVTGTTAKNIPFSVVVSLRDSDSNPVSGTFCPSNSTTQCVTFKNGKTTLALNNGDSQTISGIPASTTYTVSEPTLPAGYTLHDITNPSGLLPAGGEAASTVTNTYTATPGLAVVKVEKQVLLGPNKAVGPTPAGKYSFALCQVEAGADGKSHCNPVSTANNQSDGTVEFPTLSYTKSGTYTYQVAEVKGHEKGVNYDSSSPQIVVTVSDSGTGKLTASISGEPTFTNTIPQEGSLPQTGDGGVLPTVIIAIIVLGAGMAVAFWPRKRR